MPLASVCHYVGGPAVSPGGLAVPHGKQFIGLVDHDFDESWQPWPVPRQRCGRHAGPAADGWVAVPDFPRTWRASQRGAMCPAAHPPGALGMGPGRVQREHRTSRRRANHQCRAGLPRGDAGRPDPVVAGLRQDAGRRSAWRQRPGHSPPRSRTSCASWEKRRRVSATAARSAGSSCSRQRAHPARPSRASAMT
jgi:hypothetical protein